MKKYNVLECSKCKKQIEELNNNINYKPNKCYLTYKCNGVLRKINEKDTRTINNPLQYNFISRFDENKINKKEINNELKEINSGKSSIILVDKRNQEMISKNFKTLMKSAYSSTEYIFFRNDTNNIIKGYDESSYRKKLTIPQDSNILVYINDIITTDYGIVNDTIIINKYDKPHNEVKVIIREPIIEKIIHLNFLKLNNQIDCAYSNVEYVIINNEKYFLYYFDISLMKNVELLSLEIDEFFILLSKPPFTKYEINYDQIVKFNEGTLLKFNVDDSIILTSQPATQIFPQLFVKFME